MNRALSVLFVLSIYVIGQAFTFFQLQGHLWNKWIRDNPFLMTLIGIPLTYVTIRASRVMVDLWGGQTWPNRLIGFSIGVIVFTVMAKYLLGEVLSTKTAICLCLCLCILLIQLFWK